MVHPDNIHNGFSFDAACEEQEFQDRLLHDATTNFNFWHSFAHIEKIPTGGYIGCCFGTTKDNYAIINKLINEAHIIESLIKHLSKNLYEIIKNSLLEDSMDFASFKGEEFVTQKGLVFHEPQHNQHKIKLLTQMGLITSNTKEPFDNFKLSPQEISCLRNYLHSKSIKKISRELNLANTTVTDYIENIKNKLRCNNKNELFEKAEILKCFGYI
jgi:DNA-binding CsgD family transcriptional regulator